MALTALRVHHMQQTVSNNSSSYCMSFADGPSITTLGGFWCPGIKWGSRSRGRRALLKAPGSLPPPPRPRVGPALHLGFPASTFPRVASRPFGDGRITTSSDRNRVGKGGVVCRGRQVIPRLCEGQDVSTSGVEGLSIFQSDEKGSRLFVSDLLCKTDRVGRLIRLDLHLTSHNKARSQSICHSIEFISTSLEESRYIRAQRTPLLKN